MNIIFLDIDGVLNCDIYFAKEKSEGIIKHPLSHICKERVGWLNELCAKTEAKVVLSSTWRYSGLKYCQDVLKEAGATFEIIDVTPNLRGENCLRGNEILAWVKSNQELLGYEYDSDFKSYAIIDDDSDMLYWQRNNFFQTDTYSGLTPNICYKIKRFFNH
jgi:hypothetical protein